MKDEVIVHLGAMGVPISWSITALYRDALGVAIHAADSWYARSVSERSEKKSEDSPQFVCQIKEGRVTFARLWLGEHHLQRQSYTRDNHLVQFGTAPCDIPEAHRTLIVEALRSALIEAGYFIPIELWRRLYPAQALVSKRFCDFNEAYDAHKASGAKGRMPFDPRWTMMMELPEGYVLPYAVVEAHDGHHIQTTRDGADTLEVWSDKETAETRARLLNSGWTRAEVDILLTEEPVKNG